MMVLLLQKQQLIEKQGEDRTWYTSLCDTRHVPTPRQLAAGCRSNTVLTSVGEEWLTLAVVAAAGKRAGACKKRLFRVRQTLVELIHWRGPELRQVSFGTRLH